MGAGREDRYSAGGQDPDAARAVRSGGDRETGVCAVRMRLCELVRGCGPEEALRASDSRRLDSAIGEDPACISVPAMDVEAGFDRLPVGLTSRAAPARHVPAPLVKPAPLRNVVGLLRGSDPVLRDQYVLVSRALRSSGEDGCGRHFQRRERQRERRRHRCSNWRRRCRRENPHPRRTLVFVCFFGEEKGLFGSDWYVKHPLVPLAQTVADINFEQLGEPAE